MPSHLLHSWPEAMREGPPWLPDLVLPLFTRQGRSRATDERASRSDSVGERFAPRTMQYGPSPVDPHRDRSHLVCAFFAVNENMVASRVDRTDTEEIKSVCLSGNGSTHGSESGGLWCASGR
jgi:hypothetical protein